MKNLNFSMIVMLVLAVIFAGNVSAQTYGTGYDTIQVVRNTNPIIYTVANPDRTKATFTWTVTEGTIVATDDTSYQQVGTDADTVFIAVRWDSTETTAVNRGRLRVVKSVTTGTNTCVSEIQRFHVHSWVAPRATITTPSDTLCSGSTISTIDVSFRGKSDYRYQWQLLRGGNVVAQSSGELTSNTSSVSIPVNYNVVTGGTYTFQVTNMYDDFTDYSSTSSASVASVDIIVLAAPVIGPVRSSSSLTER